MELLILSALFGLSLLINSFTPLPGALTVMAILFTLLKLKVVKESYLKTITPFLLIHISFFFIPPAAKVVEAVGSLEGTLVKLIITLVLSNIIVMGVTGVVVQALLQKKGERGGKDE